MTCPGSFGYSTGRNIINGSLFEKLRMANNEDRTEPSRVIKYCPDFLSKFH